MSIHIYSVKSSKQRQNDRAVSFASLRCLNLEIDVAACCSFQVRKGKGGCMSCRDVHCLSTAETSSVRYGNCVEALSSIGFESGAVKGDSALDMNASYQP